MPDIYRLVNRSAAICRSYGVCHYCAYMIVADVSAAALAEVMERNDSDPSWLAEVEQLAMQLADLHGRCRRPGEPGPLRACSVSGEAHLPR